MVLKGEESSQSRESRLYRFGADRVALQIADGARLPSVSGDGSVVGLIYTGVCVNPDCVDRLPQAEVRGRETLRLGPGDLQVSRNGRWALLRKYPAPAENPLLLVDLSTGHPVPLPPDLFPAGSDRMRLTSDPAGRPLAARPYR